MYACWVQVAGCSVQVQGVGCGVSCGRRVVKPDALRVMQCIWEAGVLGRDMIY